MSYSFICSKDIHIKLLNGEIFTIEVNDFEEPFNIMKKILDYKIEDTTLEDKYKLREHRAKFFIERNNTDQDESKYNVFYSISNINPFILENGDILCIISEIPENPVKKYFYYNNFFNLSNESEEKNMIVNHFLIKDLESVYDCIDILYFRNYDENIPLFFDITNISNIKYKENKIYDLIDIFIENIETKRILFRTKCVQDIFVKSLVNKLNNRNISLKILGLDIKSINYFDNNTANISLKTLGLDVNINIEEFFRIINNKYFVDKHYINSICFEFKII